MRKNCCSFPVEFIDDVFAEAKADLAGVLKSVTGAENPKVLIVADYNVVQRNADLGVKIGRYAHAHGLVLAGAPVVLAGGEKIKGDTLQSALRVASAILVARLGQSDCVLAIGGGSILDVAGWAAAQVRGGVKIVRMPTTPAAMVDCAFSERASLNNMDLKEALIVPSIPAAVVIDLTFARTVLDGVWRGGFSEIVRLACVCDAPLLKRLGELAKAYHNRDYAAMSELVRAAVAVREKKSPGDFAEWAAHKLETMSGYKLPHGYAMALGLVIDLHYSVNKGRVAKEDRDAVFTMLVQCGAMDGASHSRHLLSQTDRLLQGLEDHRLATGSLAIALPNKIGKLKVEEEPDLKEMRAVIDAIK